MGKLTTNHCDAHLKYNWVEIINEKHFAIINLVSVSILYCQCLVPSNCPGDSKVHISNALKRNCRHAASTYMASTFLRIPSHFLPFWRDKVSGNLLQNLSFRLISYYQACWIFHDESNLATPLPFNTFIQYKCCPQRWLTFGLVTRARARSFSIASTDCFHCGFSH